MKKFLLIGGVAFSALSFAQENSIKVNPAAFLGGTDLVSYERKFGDHITGVVGAGYGGYKLGGYKYNSIGGGLQGRYYFKEALTGFYGAIVADYLNGKVKMDSAGFAFMSMGGADVPSTKSEINFSGYGGGLRAGYQWLFDSGFTLDFNLGASYRAFTYKYDTASEEMQYKDALKGNGILPSGSIGIGYTF